MPLNERQRRFVAEYLIDLNATQAAIRAGYSEKTAYSMGQRLLKDVEIASALAEAQQARSERTEITQDRVLEELAKLGFGDLRKLFTPEGNLLPPEDWPDDAAASIASVEVVMKNLGDGEVERVQKIRTWDKPKALELIARHLGMLNDKLKVDATVSLADRIREGYERANNR